MLASSSTRRRPLPEQRSRLRVAASAPPLCRLQRFPFTGTAPFLSTVRPGALFHILACPEAPTMKTRLLSPVLLLTGLLTGLLTCAARSDDVLVCGTEDSLTQQMNQTLGTPIATDSLVEARVVFVTFPDDAIQTRPSWAYGFRSEMADYIGTMSRGAQHLSILIL